MRLSTPRMLIAATFGLALSAGCGSSTSPIMDPLVFEGEIAAAGRETHPLVLTNSGTIRVEFTRLEEKPAEGLEPLAVDWIMGFGIGRPSGEDCATRYSVSARVGQLVVLGLNEADYCIAVFDSGFLPAERVIEYAVTVSPAN